MNELKIIFYDINFNEKLRDYHILIFNNDNNNQIKYSNYNNLYSRLDVQNLYSIFHINKQINIFKEHVYVYGNACLVKFNINKKILNILIRNEVNYYYNYLVNLFSDEYYTIFNKNGIVNNGYAGDINKNVIIYKNIIINENSNYNPVEYFSIDLPSAPYICDTSKPSEIIDSIKLQNSNILKRIITVDENKKLIEELKSYKYNKFKPVIKELKNYKTVLENYYKVNIKLTIAKLEKKQEIREELEGYVKELKYYRMRLSNYINK